MPSFRYHFPNIASTELLNNDLDMAILRDGYKQMTAFMSTAPALSGFVTGAYTNISSVITDEDIDAFNRANMYVFLTTTQVNN